MHDRHDVAVKPDESIYHIVMHIYSHNKERRAPEKAEELLADMHSTYYLAGDQGLKPSTLTFNTLLNNYAKLSLQVDEAADRVESIFLHMEDLHERGFGNVQPDIIHFIQYCDQCSCKLSWQTRRRPSCLCYSTDDESAS